MREEGDDKILLARIVIPKETQTSLFETIVKPTKKCTCITTSGQLWDIEVSVFEAREELIREAWEKKRELFTKRE